MRDFFVSCPFHEGDRTPSLSVLLQDRNGLRAGFAHCFACGWSGNYRQVEKALGHPLNISPKIRSVLEQRSTSSVSPTFGLRTAVAHGMPRSSMKKAELPFKFSRYLKNRGIGEVVQRFNRIHENDRLNMPFFDPQGNWIGSVERSTSGNKFYKVNGSIRYPIGIEEVDSGDFVYITEGQIDKMSLEEAGFRAVALGTVSNYRLIKHLKNFNLCFAFDNDEAGKKATEMAFQFIIQSRRPNLYTLELPHQVKDINELLLDMKLSGERSETFTNWVKLNTKKL